MKNLNLKLKKRVKTDESLKNELGELIPYNDYYFEYPNLNTGELEEYRIKPADLVSKKLLKDFYVKNSDIELDIFGETRFASNNTDGTKTAYHVFAVKVYDENFKKETLCYITPIGGNNYAHYILTNSVTDIKL